MPSERYWSVALASFPRDTQAAAAVQMLEQVRAAGLTQAYVEERGRAIVIAFGKYDSPGDAQARRDLERIKHTKVGETEPFAFAVLSPPAFEPTQGSMPQFELRNSREQYGKGILYTLQIGVYWRADGQRPTAKDTAEYRAAAEKAAVQLRREGEEAFYYHGPLRSMVTVGVFSERDYDMKDLSKQSPRLLRLREKFPYNLENGAAIKRKRPGQAEAHFDPSFVVTVPD